MGEAHDCCKVNDNSGDMPGARDQPVYITSSGAYGMESNGSLMTLPTFGCTLHKAKEA